MYASEFAMPHLVLCGDTNVVEEQDICLTGNILSSGKRCDGCVVQLREAHSAKSRRDAKCSPYLREHACEVRGPGSAALAKSRSTQKFPALQRCGWRNFAEHAMGELHGAVCSRCFAIPCLLKTARLVPHVKDTCDPLCVISMQHAEIAEHHLRSMWRVMLGVDDHD